MVMPRPDVLVVKSTSARISTHGWNFLLQGPKGEGAMRVPFDFKAAKLVGGSYSLSGEDALELVDETRLMRVMRRRLAR